MIGWCESWRLSYYTTVSTSPQCQAQSRLNSIPFYFSRAGVIACQPIFIIQFCHWDTGILIHTDYYSSRRTPRLFASCVFEWITWVLRCPYSFGICLCLLHTLESRAGDGEGAVDYPRHYFLPCILPILPRTACGALSGLPGLLLSLLRDGLAKPVQSG